MSYDVNIIKDILLKLKEIGQNKTISLKDFPENLHKEISENVRQLGKEDFISGRIHTKEKNDNDVYDFNIQGLKSRLRGLQLLEILKNDDIMKYFLVRSHLNPQPTLNQTIEWLKERNFKVGTL